MGSRSPACPHAHAPTRPRIILVTVPKSGTYLLSEIVARLGFHQTYLHLAPEHLTAYDPTDLDAGRADPERYRVECPIDQSVRLVRPGEFAVGHLPFTAVTTNSLDGFRVIFLTRDLRTALESWRRFRIRTGRTNAAANEVRPSDANLAKFIAGPGAQAIKRAESMSRWASRPGVLTIDHTGLKSDARVVSRIREFLGGAPGDDEAVLRESLGAPTLTRSPTPTDLDHAWGPLAERAFEALGGPAINEALGYDLNAPKLAAS